MEFNAYGNKFEEQPDGSTRITTKAGQVFNIDKDGNTSVSLESIKSLGITHLVDVVEHHITDAVGSRSHVVRFSNGGVLKFAYNAQGTLLSLSATNLMMTMTKDNEIQYGVPDRDVASDGI